MLAFLLSLLPNFLKVYLGIKVSTAESLGKAEERNDIDRSNSVIMSREAEASANAPQTLTEMEKLLKEHKVCLALLILPLLTSCADNVTYGTACPVPRIWPPMQQDEIAANLAVMPSDSPLIGVVIEWERLRTESKACLGQMVE